jgi:hypothetical protein
LTSRKTCLESAEEDLKEMGVRKCRRTASRWTENSGGQFWKRLRSAKVCDARIRRRRRRRRRMGRRRRRWRRRRRTIRRRRRGENKKEDEEEKEERKEKKKNEEEKGEKK